MSNDLTFGYRGEVSLSVSVNDNIIPIFTRHNGGTMELHKIFAMLMAGYEVGEVSPKLITLQKTSAEGYTKISPDIDLSGKQFTQKYNAIAGETNWTAKFSARFKYSQILEPITAGGSYRLVLSSYEHDLAYLDVTSTDLIHLQPGTQMLIEWTMQLVG